MRLRTTLLAASIFLLLAACSKHAEPEPIYLTPPPPEIPADVQACVSAPVRFTEKELDAGEVERLWKTDRARLARVNKCLRRLICSVAEYRREISKVEEKLCEAKQ